MNRKLITSDWHIRSTVPVCVDATPSEWMDIQKEALQRLGDIAIENKVKDIYIGGDLFHKENTTTFECIYLIQEFIQRMESVGIRVWIMAGNHDLPYHSSTNIPKAAIGVLLNSQYVHNMADSKSEIRGCNFDNDDYGNATCIFKHVLTIPKEEIPYGVECETPESLLEKYPNTVRICTGDYHKNFYFEKDGRIVVNSGCLTKQASDFENYVTGIYIIDLDGTSEDDFWVPINIEQKFNHNGYEKKALDESIENFVEGIKAEDVTLDYVSSLKKEATNHDKPIQDKIESWITEAGQ